MDGYNDGYYTQPFRQRQVIEGSFDPRGAPVITGASPNVRILIPQGHAPSTPGVYQQSKVDRPAPQVYRVGPRFNASVLRAGDRRGSVDSGLAHVIRLGRRDVDVAGRPRVVRLAPGYDGESAQSPQPRVVQFGPGVGAGQTGQVIHVGPSAMRIVPRGGGESAQPVYRIVPVDSVQSPTTASYLQKDPVRAYQIQTDERGSQLPSSPAHTYPRVVSYSVTPSPQQSETDRVRQTYSTEYRPSEPNTPGRPVVYRSGPGGWTLVRQGSDDDRVRYVVNPAAPSYTVSNTTAERDPNESSGSDGARRFLVQIGGGDTRRGSVDVSGSSSGTQQQQQYPTSPATRMYGTGETAAAAQPSTPPVVTVRTVGQFGGVGGQGPVTDFGELVCQSIRHFLAQKQQQQRAAEEHQHQYSNPATPWRRPRNVYAAESTAQSPRIIEAQVVDGRRSGSPQVDVDKTIAESPTPDDRNIFQKYRFQFGSIGNFGRTNSRDDGSETGTGSWNPNVRRTSGGSSGPIAVFCFQDFDDMVAKMRELRDQVYTPQPSLTSQCPQNSDATFRDTTAATNAPIQGPSRPHQSSPAVVRSAWPAEQQARYHANIEEDDEDSGYGTSSNVSTLVRSDYHPSVSENNRRTNQTTREELRSKIAAFNNNAQGIIMSLEQNSDIFHGFIRVQMNLIRPVQMALTSDPPSIYDALNHDDKTVTSCPDGESGTEVTKFYLPKDTMKVIHITSETATKEVIRTLLSKFRIRDNPMKFALYETSENDQGSSMRRLGDTELPLPLCLSWAEKGTDALNRTKFVLQENDTGEIMWEAFSLPELESFLLIINKEEDEYLKEIKTTFRLLKIHMTRRLKELRKDRVGPGAKLQPVAS